MLSRVAENAYWLARHLERAEDTARLISATTLLALDLPKSVAPDWNSLDEILGRAAPNSGESSSEERVVTRLILDDTDPSSIASSVRFARNNAQASRDVLPGEMWEGINALHLLLQEHTGLRLGRRRRLELLRQIIQLSQRVQGVQVSTLSRDQLYRFLCIGQGLERGDMTTRIVDVRAARLLPLDEADEIYPPIAWMSLLSSLGAFEMYRQQRRPSIGGSEVIDFLFRDHRFPRSVHFCAREVGLQLRNLGRADEASAHLQTLRRRLSAANPGRMAPAALHAFIDRLQLDLARAHDGVHRTYFGRH